MVRIKKVSTDPPKKKRPRGRTLVARQNQMINLAVELAERQLVEGTASSQVITHFLKLATTRERLEQLKLEKETALLVAKADSIRSGQTMNELYEGAIEAMRKYSGNAGGSDDSD